MRFIFSYFYPFFLGLGHLRFPKVWAHVTSSPGGPSPAVEARSTLGQWSEDQAGTQSNQYVVVLIYSDQFRVHEAASTDKVHVTPSFLNPIVLGALSGLYPD